MKGISIVAAATALFAGAFAADVDPIVIKGSKFFYKTNGTQFYMKGVAYQQGVSTNTTESKKADYTDNLADADSCKRDIEYLTKLNTNTIRVYAIDPTKNHDDCMNALAAAGIYVIADLSAPVTDQSINRDDPQWNTAVYSRYTSVVDAMQKYTNTLGFFAGNEVSNAPNNTFASAFVKAAVRDMKSYIKSKNYRTIGVGYATNDDADIRENLASYFDCGDASTSIDFWGYNIYSWCGDSSFTKSGFDVRTKEFEKYNVPVFFAEYGCNTPRPRKFTEVGALYGSQMNNIWSGGIVYMYFEEENQFGLVSIDNNKVSTNDDFDNLSSQIAKATPTGVKMGDYNPSNTAAASCPATTSDWNAAATPLPPVVNQQACDCMSQTLTCVPNADKVGEDDYADMFGILCGFEKGKYCAGINRNMTIGNYGAYGMCNSTQQLGFALSQYAKANPNGGCDFKGKAKTTAAASSTPSACAGLLKEAGPAGTGTLTSSPQGTGGPASSGGAKGSPGAAAGLHAPRFENGLFGLGIYLGAAVLSGMAMIIL